MRRIFLVIVLLTLAVGSAQAGIFFRDAGQKNPVTITGAIATIGRSYLEIVDEDDNLVKRLKYFGKDEFKVGERVRVWFDPQFLVIEQIKRMAVVEYNPDGQNKGFIYKR